MKLRLEKLNLDYIHLQVPDKKDCFDKLIKEHNIDKEEVLYMGDDLPDFLVMQEVGLACCPIDAVPEIKEISHYISDRKGGDACVRDVVEQVMKVQGTWMNSDCYHW
jgi:3-deoxy-D-manno-octulosonate 8-phosphate phosphatase (KDO 8-P phosphatase)